MSKIGMGPGPGKPSVPPGIEPMERMHLRRMNADRPYITCRELIDFLYLYLEDELPKDRRHEFERHLGVCPSCRAYIREYQEAVRLGRAAFAEPEALAEEAAPAELVRAILASRPRS
jgi:anti-sigma factor RsiW